MDNVLALLVLICSQLMLRVAAVSEKTMSQARVSKLRGKSPQHKGNHVLLANHSAPQTGRIDFVYTWVNGSDPVWQHRHAHDSGEINKNAAADSNLGYRFMHFDELRYSLRSLHQFMEPTYLGNIYIVTAGQTPTWLKPSSQVKIVSHWEIIPPELLHANAMTYNSFAIESWVHRIPGLSEQFVLMNDDMFLAAPVLKSDLFDDENRPKIAFQIDEHSARIFSPGDQPSPDADAYRWAIYNSYHLLDLAFAKDFRYALLHQAYPTTKSMYAQAHARFHKQLEATTSHQFRSKGDVIPHFLAAWVGIYQGEALQLPPKQFPSAHYVMLGNEGLNNYVQLEWVLNQRGNIKLACVGNHITDMAVFAETSIYVKHFFSEYFPSAAAWEK